MPIIAQPGNGFTCQEAVCLSNNQGVVLSNLNSPPTPPLNFTCGVTHNNLFYAFCPETGPVTIDIAPSNCTTGLGIQAIIYETNDCANFIEHKCISNGNVDPFSINFLGTPGQTYILMIDGFSGDVCDFYVAGTGVLDIENEPLEPELDVDDDLVNICEGESIDINVVNDDDQNCVSYFWEVRSGLGFMSLSEEGNKATILAFSEGVSEVCVIADNFCYEEEKCFEVHVTPPPRLDPVGDVVSCEEFIDFCDYINFFEPALEPDPITEGWDISFHSTYRDAELGSNQIVCPYDLSGSSEHTIYIRVSTGSDCYTIQDFFISDQEPSIDNLEMYFLCEGDEMDLLSAVGSLDSNGLVYSRNSFFSSRQDAENDVGEIIPPVINSNGWYYQRVQTDFGCVGIDSFEVKESSAEDIENWDVEFDEFGGIISVKLSIDGEDEPFSYHWSDGYFGPRRTRLEYGDVYDITVVNSYGCAVVQTIPIRYASSINECDDVEISPALIDGDVEIRIDGPIIFDAYEIFDVSGNIVVSNMSIFDQRFDVPSLDEGIYLVFLSNSELTCIKKIIVI